MHREQIVSGNRITDADRDIQVAKPILKGPRKAGRNGRNSPFEGDDTRTAPSGGSERDSVPDRGADREEDW